MATVEQLPDVPSNVVTDEQIANWKVGDPIPQGYREKDGKLIKKRIMKKGGTRNKPKKPVFATPTGGLTSAALGDDGSLKGFVVGTHAKLKAADFDDVLDYARFNVWYHRQLLKNAEDEHNSIANSGATKEERKANLDSQRSLKMAKNAFSKEIASADPKKKAALQAELEAMLAQLMS